MCGFITCWSGLVLSLRSCLCCVIHWAFLYECQSHVLISLCLFGWFLIFLTSEYIYCCSYAVSLFALLFCAGACVYIYHHVPRRLTWANFSNRMSNLILFPCMSKSCQNILLVSSLTVSTNLFSVHQIFWFLSSHIVATNYYFLLLFVTSCLVNKLRQLILTVQGMSRILL